MQGGILARRSTCPPALGGASGTCRCARTRGRRSRRSGCRPSASAGVQPPATQKKSTRGKAGGEVHSTTFCHKLSRSKLVSIQFRSCVHVGVFLAGSGLSAFPNALCALGASAFHRGGPRFAGPCATRRSTAGSASAARAPRGSPTAGSGTPSRPPGSGCATTSRDAHDSKVLRDHSKRDPRQSGFQLPDTCALWNLSIPLITHVSTFLAPPVHCTHPCIWIGRV